MEGAHISSLLLWDAPGILSCFSALLGRREVLLAQVSLGAQTPNSDEHVGIPQLSDLSQACGRNTWNKPCLDRLHCYKAALRQDIRHPFKVLLGLTGCTKGSQRNGDSLQLTSQCLSTQLLQSWTCTGASALPQEMPHVRLPWYNIPYTKTQPHTTWHFHSSPPRHPRSPPHPTVHAASLPGHKNSSFPSCTPTHRLPVAVSREKTNVSSKPETVQQQSPSVSHHAGRL